MTGTAIALSDARQALRKSLGGDLDGYADMRKPFHGFARLIECG